jgi:ribosome-associated toxin RatA of RatAB toxin-antitoxin module
MAEQTTSSIRIDAAPADVMAVIADFDAYPEWTGAVREVEVISTDRDGRADTVRFVLDAGAIKDEYVLAYTWTGDEKVTWTMVRGSVLKAMDGSYALSAGRSAGGREATDVTYHLTVDVKIPMIGMIKRKAEKMIIETALTELKKRVES